MDQQSLYATIQTHTKLDNKESHLLSMVIWKEVTRYGKFWEAEGAKAERAKWETKNLAERAANSDEMTEEEAKERFIHHLKMRAAEGEFDAAMVGKLIEVFGVKAKDRDISIKMVNFRDAYPDDVKIIDVAAEVIRKKIEEANRGADEELHH